MSREEIIRMALEALEWNYNTDLDNIPACEQWAKMLKKTITALRQAIEQSEQEPVGWYDSISGEMDFTFYRPLRKPSSPSAEWIPVYAAPPKREWVGLTDEEIAEIECVEMKYIGTGEYVIDGEYEFARAIEAKLKEKNT